MHTRQSSARALLAGPDNDKRAASGKLTALGFMCGQDDTEVLAVVVLVTVSFSLFLFSFPLVVWHDDLDCLFGQVFFVVYCVNDDGVDPTVQIIAISPGDQFDGKLLEYAVPIE